MFFLIIYVNNLNIDVIDVSVVVFIYLDQVISFEIFFKNFNRLLI